MENKDVIQGVFYINAGNLPANKAEEYANSIQAKINAELKGTKYRAFCILVTVGDTRFEWFPS